MKAAASRPRLGFLGVGWIGRHRMQAIVETGAAEAVAVCDPSAAMAEGAAAIAPGCLRAASLDELLDAGLDGLVIATPSALHAEQAMQALERGVAVFCQKPLGRSAGEVQAVIEAARRADRLLAVDLSYRHTAAVRAVEPLVRGGELGRVYAAELCFHNAYGPDKPWFRDARLSGGGCVMDLGTHLVDLVLWMLAFPRVLEIRSTLLAGGRRVRGRGDRVVEDYAAVELVLDGGVSARLACSWNLPAGRDAVIEASFYGDRGGVSVRNVNGSFHDLVAERFRGTSREALAEPPDAWGGRAAAAFAAALARSPRFDPSVERLLDVARTLDGIYAA